MKQIESVEAGYLKKNLPEFKVGDTLNVHLQIKEEDKARIQPFEGIVIARHGQGTRATFTLRRIFYGEGVERTFQLHSPLIEKIEVVKTGKIHRAKLYYLRKKIGKKTKIEENLETEQPETAPVRTQPPAQKI